MMRAPGETSPTTVLRGRRTLGIFAVAAVAAFGFPGASLGADGAGSKVLRIDPSTGARTVLTNNGDWHALPGIAVGPTGTVYVAAEGRGHGLFSLTAPGFAIVQLGKSWPEGLALSGQTLYTLNSAGVGSNDINPPFTGRLLSQNDPADLLGIAAAGSTVYGTWAKGCGSGRPASAIGRSRSLPVRRSELFAEKILGAMIQGIKVDNGAFAGGAFDWATPFAVLCGLGLVAGYALLGATWLVMKTEGSIARRARTEAKLLCSWYSPSWRL